MKPLEFEQRNATLGRYFPGFGIIEINKTDFLPPNKWITSATFAHEFIHFLQDVTTCSGFTSIIKLKDLIDVFRTENGNEKIILTPHIVSTQFVLDDLAMYDQHRGSIALINNPYEIININPIGNGIDFKIELNIKSSDGSTTNYYLGIAGIQEIMADVFERRHSKYSPSDFAPYDLWKKINDFYQKPISEEQWFHICWVSLDTLSPADTFYKLITLSDIVKCSSDDIYKYATRANSISRDKESKDYLRNITFESADYLFSGIESDYSLIFKEFITKSEAHFSVDNRIKFFNLGPESQNFHDCLSLIGTGAVMAIDDPSIVEYVPNYHQNDSASSFPLALKEIYAHVFLQRKGFKCGLTKYCENSENLKSYMGIECELSPWEHTKKANGCPYAILWHRFQLTKAILKKR